MKKVLSILGIIVSLLIIIGLSIWIGFPIEGFDRTPICFVGYSIGVITLVICIMAIFSDSFL
jgi:hypothetical protein